MAVSHGEIASAFSLVEKYTQNRAFSQKNKTIYFHAILRFLWDPQRMGSTFIFFLCNSIFLNKEYTTRGILHEIYLHNFPENINGFGKKTVSYSLHVIGVMVKLSHGALCYRFVENENSTQKIFKNYS